MGQTTISACGKDFRQSWPGLLRKSSTQTRLSKHRQTANPLLDAGPTALLNNLDSNLSLVSQLLKKLDEDIYNSIRVGRHRNARAAMKSTGEAEYRTHARGLARSRPRLEAGLDIQECRAGHDVDHLNELWWRHELVL
jgi:hypothetical protein